MGDAQGSIYGTIGDFAKTFSPQQPDNSKVLKLLLDALAIGYAQIAAGVWNKILKNAAVFTKPNDPNNHGWFKDSSNSLVSGSITLGKDTLPS